MNFLLKDKLFKLIRNEWFIGLILLAVFLATNGYKYGWDDQHLEIPLLKSLIDTSLYAGDYYVESLKQDFTSYLYPILARVITVDLIPITYFILFLVSRFFLFFFIYKLWLFLSQNRRLAFLCTLMIILIGRVEEFLYRTFSHQEFALAIIFAAIYLFYKERYLLASAILGLAANLHALYSLIPFVYLTGYIIIFHREKKFTTLIKSVSLFILMALPLFAWIIQKKINAYGLFDKYFYKDWVSLYKIACPQNFIFYDNTLKEIWGSSALFIERTREYWLLLVLFLTNFFFNPDFRKDKKSLSVIIVGFSLLIFSFIFTYIFPSKFVLDLNLIRNTQFMLFILMGYTVILMDKSILSKPEWMMLPIAMTLPLMRFSRLNNEMTLCAVLFLLAILGIQAQLQKQKNLLRTSLIIFFAVLSTFCLGMILYYGLGDTFNRLSRIIVLCNYALLALTAGLFFFLKDKRAWIKKIFIIIPFVVFLGNFIYYHHLHIKIERSSGSFWQLQRNWENMQLYVKENLDKDAKLLVPYDMEMGGFRILSERRILVSYRDCGIVGFNYEAGKEWQQRIKDIEPFKVMVSGPITDPIVNAILKYRVSHIVFMNYIAPADNNMLQRIYQNEIFSLYKVLVNPI